MLISIVSIVLLLVAVFMIENEFKKYATKDDIKEVEKSLVDLNNHIKKELSGLQDFIRDLTRR
jgi:cell division protein FtsL